MESSSFDLAKQFIETKPACRQALSHLKPGTEIRVLLDQTVEASVFYANHRSCIEKRSAHKPDVEFSANDKALAALAEHPGDNLGRLGIDICRHILEGNIQLRVVGSIMGVMRGGYLKIVADAGPEFGKFIASHGLSSASKIVSMIKSLKT